MLWGILLVAILFAFIPTDVSMTIISYDKVLVGAVVQLISSAVHNSNAVTAHA